MIPVLALSATPSAGNTIWDIELREGVRFHDGTPLNADAVIHHWTRVLDPKQFRGRRILRPIRSVEKADEYVVRFHLEHPWPPFLNVISNELLLFAFIPSPRAVEAGTHDKKPVGTGPFKYARWNSGDHFVVLKNEDYWQEGKPLLNKVVFRTIPDPQTRYASLVAGQIDVIAIDRGHLIRKAENDPELTVYPSQVNGAEIILMNTTRPPLDDIRVRRALAVANNQERHVKMVYGNTVPLVHHPFGDLLACEDVDYPEYDPGKAKQLIADYGKPVELEFLHSNTPRGRNIGALQQQLYKEIGVRLNPVGLSPGPHMMKVVQKDYQLATWRMPPSGDYGPNFYAKFHSQSPGNFTGYANPEMDRLLETQRIETDTAKREALLCVIACKLNRDVPILYRGGRRYHVVTRKKIRDMMETSGFTIDLAAAWMDETVKFNQAAHKIEQNASVADFDCPEPGDVEAVKAIVQGSWKGKDDMGATIKATFKENDTVTSSRTGRPEITKKYMVCGPEIHWTASGGANIRLTVTEDENSLEGMWKFGELSGKFTLARAEELSSVSQ
jgi:4-phytase/acid phosphatase/peptide/nickel transport system substrate-binding protein